MRQCQVRFPNSLGCTTLLLYYTRGSGNLTSQCQELMSIHLNVQAPVLTATFPGILAEHPRLGLEARRPGGLHQRGQVWPPRPVLPRLRLLHDGEQHDDHQLAGNHPGDAALEEGLPFNLQQSCPRRDSLTNLCGILFSGGKGQIPLISFLIRRLPRSVTSD